MGDLDQPPDKQYERMSFNQLADAPLHALGLSNSDADVLRQVLGVVTVRDLADNKFVRRAQAIVNLSGPKQTG
jgi:hypothetical protein